jgi:hypothetical protein
LVSWYGAFVIVVIIVVVVVVNEFWGRLVLIWRLSRRVNRLCIEDEFSASEDWF